LALSSALARPRISHPLDYLLIVSLLFFFPAVFHCPLVWKSTADSVKLLALGPSPDEFALTPQGEPTSAHDDPSMPYVLPTPVVGREALVTDLPPFLRLLPLSAMVDSTSSIDDTVVKELRLVCGSLNSRRRFCIIWKNRALKSCSDSQGSELADLFPSSPALPKQLGWLDTDRECDGVGGG
jgi:hypothetical protein